MELNLSSSITHNLNSAQESCGQLLEGFTPRVQLRETRSAYFINVNLSGFRKEDIRLEMDNTRTLIIKGQRYLQGMGKVEWTWHLMESGGRSFRKPFRIPQNVNVGAMTGTFHQGVLHVLMPKFRWTSRFTPYHINRSNLQDDQNLEEAVHDEAEENAGGSHGAAKINDFVGTRSNEEKDGHDQKPPEISRVEEKSNLDEEDPKPPEISTVEEKSNLDEEKDGHDQKPPEISRVEEKSNLDEDDQKPPEISKVEEKSNLDEEKDGHDQKPPEIRRVEEKSNLDEEKDEHDQKPSCLDSKGEAGEEAAEEKKRNVADDMSILTDHKEKDEHDQKPSCLTSKGVAGEQVAEEKKTDVADDMDFLTDPKEKDGEKDSLNVLAEEVIAYRESVRPHISEAEEDTNLAQPEPQTVISSNGNDDYSRFISEWNYGETFWTRRKVVVALLVSSVAAIAAFKLMRR